MRSAPDPHASLLRSAMDPHARELADARVRNAVKAIEDACTELRVATNLRAALSATAPSTGRGNQYRTRIGRVKA